MIQTSSQLESVCHPKPRRKTNDYKTSKEKIDALPDEVKQLNKEYTTEQLKRFKVNVKLAIYKSGIEVRAFFRIAAKHGVIISRQGFLSNEVRFSPNFLYLCTFSRILGIEPGYLLLKEFPELLESGKVKPNLIEQPEPKKPTKKKAA